MDDLIAHAMGFFYLSPLLIPAFFCLRWAYREVGGTERPRSFLVAVNVIVALICGITAFYFYALFVGLKVSGTNWNTGKSHRTLKVLPRMEYGKRCEEFVHEVLRCSPDIPHRDLGYFVDGVSFLEVDHEQNNFAVRSVVFCGNEDFSLKENYVPEEYLREGGSMTLGEQLKTDTRLYPTCKYSFVCETKKTLTGWETRLVSGKLERFWKNPQNFLLDPIWRPEEWEATVPVTQELCRKFLFDVKKIEK